MRMHPTALWSWFKTIAISYMSIFKTAQHYLRIRLIFIKVSKFKHKLITSKKIKIMWQRRWVFTIYKTLLFVYLKNINYSISVIRTILNSPFMSLLSLLKAVFNYTNFLKNLIKKYLNLNIKQVIGETAIVLSCLVVVLCTDALLTDDEPIWEPTEWSLLQNWLLFIFLFSWIAENLITSRYGSYTGRDKRVWFAWYKTFWGIQIYYVISLGAAALFVIIPFYHEITYITPLVMLWWDWYSRTFFFKFTSIYTLSLLLALYLQITLIQSNWKKSLVISLVINVFIAYLLYGQFFTTFFAYFTNSSWYLKTRLVDYVQLSHEPNKWAWGNTKRDHFSYHSSKTVFWYKNDGPFASAMLFFNIFFFFTIFTFHIFWLTLIRRIYSTNEITYTYTTYCVSALRQFLYSFNLFYLFIVFSFLITYWRLPIEFYWINDFLEMFN